MGTTKFDPLRTEAGTAPSLEVDALAYRFWSIHPKELDPWLASMPEGYKGGVRAWFYATEMRKLLTSSAPSPLLQRAMSWISENIQEGDAAGAALLGSIVSALASSPEAHDLSKQVDRYGIALLAICAGCGEPERVAREALERFGK